MVSALFFYQLALIALVWLCCMLHWVWRSDCGAASPTLSPPTPPLRRRRREPPPFPGLLHKPHCAACEQAHEHLLQPPGYPPPRLVPTRGRSRQVDTAQHFCPHANCDYRGWVDWGNISANGHPSGGPWRQLYCSACERYFLETHGTPFHRKRVAPDLLVWAVGALDLLSASLLTPVASRNLLLYHSLLTSILYRYANVRRRKDDIGVGTAARSITA